MSILQALLLGLVQGVAEFFPVSSSGHLILIPRLFGWPDQGLAFDVILHLGTLTALLWYFRDTLIELVLAICRPQSETVAARRLAWQIVAASLPAFVLGYWLRDLEESVTRRVPLVAFNLAFWGVVLFMADRYSRRRPSARSSTAIEVSWQQAIWIGAAQALALLPGTSRSGITITAGLFGSLSRAAAARFSFLLSIPITAAAGAHGLITLWRHPENVSADVVTLALGFAASVIAGIWAIRFLVQYVTQRSYDLFVAYRLLLALSLVVFL